jgi:hypothetical protein
MVIPPEQEQLTPEEEIFDLIYSIQSKISSQEYLFLMNTSQKLVQKINDLKQEEMSEIYDSSSIDSDRILERNISMSADEEIEETSDDTPCDCASRFVYPDDFPMYGNHQTYTQMFCHGIRIFECENFKRLCYEYPLLNNLIEYQNMPFADSETYGPYDSPKVKMVFSILLSLNDMLDFKRHKIIISLILFDFTMKNIQFIADNPETLGKVSHEKLTFFMYDEEFISIAEEFNIKLENWRLAIERAIAPPVAN